MKRSIYTWCAIAALTLTLTSCEKNIPLNEAITGRWKVISEHQIYSLENVVKREYIFHYEDLETEYEFTSGGSIIRYYYEDIDGMSTFTISGSTLTIENEDTDINWDKVSVNDKTLTWSYFQSAILGEVTYDEEIIYTAVKSN